MSEMFEADSQKQKDTDPTKVRHALDFLVVKGAQYSFKNPDTVSNEMVQQRALTIAELVSFVKERHEGIEKTITKKALGSFDYFFITFSPMVTKKLMALGVPGDYRTVAPKSEQRTAPLLEPLARAIIFQAWTDLGGDILQKGFYTPFKP